VNFKIREAQLQKIPYMLVVGGKEAEGRTVSVRHRSKGDLGARPLDAFVSDLQTENADRVTETVPRTAQTETAKK
jgi:threonyl-tRNA synthetase